MPAKAIIEKTRCIGCSQCRLICPVAAIEQAGARYEINQQRCIGCAKCLTICPVVCIHLTGDDPISR